MPDEKDKKDEKKEEPKAPPPPASEAKLKRLASLYQDIKGYKKDEDKTGNELAVRIGKTQAEAGLAEVDKLVTTTLNNEAINKLANVDDGGIKDFTKFESRRPAAPADKNAGNDVINEFKRDMVSIVAQANTAVTEIKGKIETEIKKIESGTPPSNDEWNKAFESNAQTEFNKAIDAKIEALEQDKITKIEVNPPLTKGAERDVTTIINAQIESLKNLKEQFNAEIDKQKNGTILDAIINAKHPKDPLPNQAALVEPGAQSQEEIERKIIEKKIAEEKKNEATIEDYALFARFERRELELGKVKSRRIIRDTDETIHFLHAMQPENQKENYVLWGDLTNQFKFNDDGILFTAKWHLTDAGYKKDITAILDVFYAKTGIDPAVMTVERGVSFDYLMKIAEVVQARQAANDPEIDKRPRITMSNDTIKQLIEKVKDDKSQKAAEKAEEKVRVLVAMLSGEQAVDGVYKTKLPSSEAKTEAKTTATARPAPIG